MVFISFDQYINYILESFNYTSSCFYSIYKFRSILDKFEDSGTNGNLKRIRAKKSS